MWFIRWTKPIILLSLLPFLLGAQVTIPPGQSEYQLTAPSPGHIRTTVSADISTWPKGASLAVAAYLSPDNGKTYDSNAFATATMFQGGTGKTASFDVPLVGDKASSTRRVKLVVDNMSGQSLT